MAIGYTSLLALVQPVDGTEVGTWGDDVNNGVSSILDVAIAGTQTLSTDANVTLTITQATSSGTNLSGTSAQYAIILLTGARTAARTVTLPSSSKIYVVINQTTGGYATTFKGAATTGVAVVPGVSTHIAWNGSDFQGISSVVGSLGFVDTNILASYQSSVNSYSQIINQNSYNGSTASADFIVANNLGTASTYYGDFGMNSSGFTGSGSFNAANTVYLTSTSGDLALGTTTSNAIHFVVNSGATDALTISSAGAVSLPGGTANGVAYLNGSNVLTTGAALVFNGTQLGIGISPSNTLDVNGNATFRNGSGTTIGTVSNDSGWYEFGASSNVNGAQIWSGASTGIIRFGGGSTFTEQARFDASGNLLIGAASLTSSNSNSILLGTIYGAGYWQHASGTASGATYHQFNYNGSAIGSITQAGTTGVLYNVTSDQRLKTDLGTVTSTDVIANTVIHDFTWKSDGSQARGVFAQEAAKVLPAAVKVGDDGEEVTDQWQVDYSKYVPDIIVELQSLRAEIAALKSQLKG